jgi:hypothetical protein
MGHARRFRSLERLGASARGSLRVRVLKDVRRGVTSRPEPNGTIDRPEAGSSDRVLILRGHPAPAMAGLRQLRERVFRRSVESVEKAGRRRVRSFASLTRHARPSRLGVNRLLGRSLRLGRGDSRALTRGSVRSGRLMGHVLRGASVRALRDVRASGPSQRGQVGRSLSQRRLGLLPRADHLRSLRMAISRSASRVRRRRPLEVSSRPAAGAMRAAVERGRT